MNTSTKTIRCLVVGLLLMGSITHGFAQESSIEAFVRSIVPRGFTNLEISGNTVSANEMFRSLSEGNHPSSLVTYLFYYTSDTPISMSESRFTLRAAQVELGAKREAAVVSEYSEVLAQMSPGERAEAMRIISSTLTMTSLQNMRTTEHRASAQHPDGREWYAYFGILSADLPRLNLDLSHETSPANNSGSGLVHIPQPLSWYRPGIVPLCIFDSLDEVLGSSSQTRLNAMLDLFDRLRLD